MMLSTVFRNVCSPLFLGNCRDLVCNRSSASRSFAEVWVLVSGWIDGEGIVSKLWWAQ